MSRCTWTFDFVSFLLTASIAVCLLMPVTFKNSSCVRSNFLFHGRPPCGPGHWTKSLTVDQLANYFVFARPSPYLPLGEESLVRFWRLPAGTRLSEGMRALAICRMAVDRKASRGVSINPGICDRVDAPWARLVLVIALLNVACHTVLLLTDLKDNRRRFWLALASAMSWWMAQATGDLRALDAKDGGLSYTLYGDIQPTPFYDRPPLAWGIAYGLVVVCFFLKLAEAAWLSIGAKHGQKWNRRSPARLDARSIVAEWRFVTDEKGKPFETIDFMRWKYIKKFGVPPGYTLDERTILKEP